MSQLSCFAAGFDNAFAKMDVSLTLFISHTDYPNRSLGGQHQHVLGILMLEVLMLHIEQTVAPRLHLRSASLASTASKLHVQAPSLPHSSWAAFSHQGQQLLCPWPGQNVAGDLHACFLFFLESGLSAGLRLLWHGALIASITCFLDCII
jgi:hypothetical protein